MTDDRYSTTEAARMLGVSRQTLYNWIADGTAAPSMVWAGRQLWSLGRIRQVARTHGRTIGDDS